jgi:excinuclease ABC subunit C
MLIIEKLKNIAKSAPKKPGIYFWLDKNGKIIYIGRANNLYNRLSQYFQKNLDKKTKEMVSKANNLKYLETNSILESIFLEAENIKKYWPLYNIKDRDDRSFIYVLIDKNKYPKIILKRANDLKKIEKKDYHIFGPYQSYRLISNALRLIRHIFPYSLCQPLSNKACFDRQIGLCPGTCLGEINQKDYKKNINNIKLLLSGNKEKLLKKLIKENPRQAKSLKHLQEVSLIEKEKNLDKSPFFRIEAYDISHWQGKNAYGSMVVEENTYLKKSDYRLFKIKEAPAGDDERALEEVLIRRFKHQEWPKPDIVLIDGGKPQISWLNKVMIKNKIKIDLIGLSKFKKDHLVFLPKTNLKKRKEVSKIKDRLILLRDEAHRFANYGRSRSSKKEFLA